MAVTVAGSFLGLVGGKRGSDLCFRRAQSHESGSPIWRAQQYSKWAHLLGQWCRGAGVRRGRAAEHRQTASPAPESWGRKAALWGGCTRSRLPFRFALRLLSRAVACQVILGPAPGQFAPPSSEGSLPQVGPQMASRLNRLFLCFFGLLCLFLKTAIFPS